MAAKAEKFNLMDLLNQRSKQKQEAEEQHPAAEGTQEERTEENKQQGNNVFMVDAYDMIPSKDNFYHVDAALKRSIELVGILQPCIVKKPVNGKYDVIAGHRRRLASLALVEEGKEQFRYIPCMYKKEETADKLAIIMANSFRDKTDFEKMVEIIQLKELVRDIKKEYNLAGRVREMQEELTGITKAQISRYEAIYNNLEKELMEEFKAGRLIMSVAVEVSGMEHEWQMKAYERLLENGELTLPEVKQMKKQIEAESQCPGQMVLPEIQDEEPEQEAEPEEQEKETEETEETPEQETELEEWEDPTPETVESLCYSCDKYEVCHEKKATVTKCNAYVNRKEARLTEEQKYNREQAAIDRETKKKLKEKEQEEKNAESARGHKEKEVCTNFKESARGNRGRKEAIHNSERYRAFQDGRHNCCAGV